MKDPRTNMNDVSKLHMQFKKDFSNLSSLSDLAELQIKYLGRKGVINDLLQSINLPAGEAGKLKSEEKKEFYKKVNDLKTSIKHLIKGKKNELVNTSVGHKYFDITLPGKNFPKGSLHLVTYAIEEISRIFEKIGFIRMSYPEVEWEYFSFDSLNMPKNHPARDDFETFFLDFPENPKYGKMVLTPHTSSGQIREMQRLGKPPIRMINIAKCYRPNWDTTHTPMFHQFEGMVVDKNINITHLKGTIDYFAKQFFGDHREIRLRPFHFQFTEPSFEVDITCGVCNGSGVILGTNEVRTPESNNDSGRARMTNKFKCRVCKSGWLELGGSGMIHPNVLKVGNIDPEIYSGWAFGFGVERVLLMKENLNIDDLRIIYDNDIRFLEQF